MQYFDSRLAQKATSAGVLSIPLKDAFRKGYEIDASVTTFRSAFIAEQAQSNASEDGDESSIVQAVTVPRAVLCLAFGKNGRTD